jgi:RimJ/RimL family protein N-acetyltransferase
MQLAEFIAFHAPALERDEVRHNLILAIMAQAARVNPAVETWTLGEPGACAIKWPGRLIVLGEVTREQCHVLAEATRDLDYPGVVGLDPGPAWFVERAGELGLRFSPEPIPQRVHVLRRKPLFPGAPGAARQTRPEDGPLLADWLEAFHSEAVPHDPPTVREALEKVAGHGRHTFWIVDGMPVSVAGVARRLATAAAIAPVYTPPALRGRGFAGSVTASVAERLFAEGKTAVCLYTDLRNAASNRCYAKIGFTGVCDSCVYLRTRP